MNKKSIQEKSKYRPGLPYTPMIKGNPLSDAKGLLIPPPSDEKPAESIKIEKHSQSMEDIRPIGDGNFMNQQTGTSSGSLANNQGLNLSGNLSGSCTNLSTGSIGNVTGMIVMIC